MRKIPRWLARAPIPVFRLGIGGLLTKRLVMIEHRGRTSGLIREVVLETIKIDGDDVYVISGYGWSSQWLRNVKADPRVRMWSGWGRGVGALATILPRAEGLAVLDDYRTRHPGTVRALATGLEIEGFTVDGPLPEDITERMPLVRIRPRR
ncbi:nitroreductase family deazaflavin-dependent oxidoreductase [Occultella glacieicola]|uniref:Nitroreductase family deazaflavin-dependent oxidoreductase n=1 Tax=Occultella glacieicola TaxID=2518684 RepID=A0ABY2DZM4_9MICO|nr:nitroreductase family deazaflavin-dependent oxidoreductase [Occultella glacieicola]TDE90333.1 nitroreductase family deazaflavin-dependent oxidoreductase [Occultella glacieicola]